MNHQAIGGIVVQNYREVSIFRQHGIVFCYSSKRSAADACTSYRVLFSMLEEFENGLYEYINLKNNVLFPKAIELEAKLEQI